MVINVNGVHCSQFEQNRNRLFPTTTEKIITILVFFLSFFLFAYFLKDLFIYLFIYFREKGREAERQGEKQQCALASFTRHHPKPLGAWPATEACALIGNRTGATLWFAGQY